MPSWLRLLVVVLAAYRITRLIVSDSEDDEDKKGFPPAVRARRWIVRRFGVESSWVDLISCPWCVGFWVSSATVLVGFHGHPLLDQLLLCWAVSTGVGAMALLIERD